MPTRPSVPPRIGFVFLKSRICLGLPLDLASRQRPCLWLTVSAINPRKGLTPSSQRPCWAYIENRRGCSPRLLVSAALIYLIVIVVVTTLVILKLLVAFKVMVCLPVVRLSTYNVSPPPNSP